MLHLRWMIFGAALLLCCAVPVRAGFILDPFTAAQTVYNFTPGTSTETAATGKGILGGDRKLVLTVGRHDLYGIAHLGGTPNGQLTFSLASSHAKLPTSYVNLIYDGTTQTGASDKTYGPHASSHLSLGGVDVTKHGANNGLMVRGYDSSTAGLDVLVELFSSSTASSSATLHMAPSASASSYGLLFSHFTGNADLTNIREIALSFSFTDNLGGSAYIQPVSFGSVSVNPHIPSAPEPASLTLLSIGLAGLAGYGWRRRNA